MLPSRLQSEGGTNTPMYQHITFTLPLSTPLAPSFPLPPPPSPLTAHDNKCYPDVRMTTRDITHLPIFY